ncbi:MAG: diaminopimelate decarboxylase [Bacteroidales bacterium]|nr:diaminopimelate decarboxylase [Bacteroidales bacterium]
MISKSQIEAFKSIETPFYFYDMELLDRTLSLYRSVTDRYGYVPHYAVKANNDARILARMREYGFGIDCVSGGEVRLAVESGFDPSKIVFAGVAKTDAEIRYAIQAGIGCFNCESLQELEIIDSIARSLGRRAPVAFRINPDIDAHTHKYISTGLEENKFGISLWAFDALVELLGKCGNVEYRGLHFHVGSQITDNSVFKLLCSRATEICSMFEAAGLRPQNINFGGGLGVDYNNPGQNPIPDIEGYFDTIHTNFNLKEGQTLHFEPGRSLVAQCGHLISRVSYVKVGKEKKFVILDAGMNDLIRPALYEAHHDIENLTSAGNPEVYDVVGPICESSDCWIRDLSLPEVSRGDIFAIHTAGAYGQVMAMLYNCRPFAKAYYSDLLQ